MQFNINKDNMRLNVVFSGVYLTLIYNIFSLSVGFGKPIIFPFFEINLFSILSLIVFQYMNPELWKWGNDRIRIKTSGGLYEVCWTSSGIDCKVVVQRVKIIELFGGKVFVSFLSKVWESSIENSLRLRDVESFSPSKKYAWYHTTISDYENRIEQTVTA